MLHFHDWFIRRRNVPIAFLHFKSNDTVVQTTVNQFRWLVGWLASIYWNYLFKCMWASFANSIEIVWTGNRTHCSEYRDRVVLYRIFGTARWMCRIHCIWFNSIDFVTLYQYSKRAITKIGTHTDRWIGGISLRALLSIDIAITFTSIIKN